MRQGVDTRWTSLVQLGSVGPRFLLRWRVEPHHGWQGRWLGQPAYEALRIGGKGRRQDHLALLVQLGRLAGMNGRRRHTCTCAASAGVRPRAVWWCSWLYQRKSCWHQVRASWMPPKRPGKVGWYLTVLNWASEK